MERDFNRGDNGRETNQLEKRRFVVFIRGLPGSGKSTLAEGIQQVVGEERSVILDPDLIDYSSGRYLDFSRRLSDQGVDVRFHPYRFLLCRVREELTASRIVLWNQPFSNLEMLEDTISIVETIASQEGLRLELLVVELEVEENLARERIERRIENGGKGPTPTTFNRFLERFESFEGRSEERSCCTFLKLRGEEIDKISIGQVVGLLKQLANEE